MFFQKLPSVNFFHHSESVLVVLFGPLDVTIRATIFFFLFYCPPFIDILFNFYFFPLVQLFSFNSRWSSRVEIIFIRVLKILSIILKIHYSCIDFICLSHNFANIVRKHSCRYVSFDYLILNFRCIMKIVHRVYWESLKYTKPLKHVFPLLFFIDLIFNEASKVSQLFHLISFLLKFLFSFLFLLFHIIIIIIVFTTTTRFTGPTFNNCIRFILVVESFIIVL